MTIRRPGGASGVSSRRSISPAAGDGAIVRAVGRVDVAWDLWEVREEERPIFQRVRVLGLMEGA